MTRWVFVVGLAMVAPTGAVAQGTRLAFLPPSPGVRVRTNVTYGTDGTTRLAMDVYRPQSWSGAVPALVFFNGVTGPDRHQPLYDRWARAAASDGIVGVLPDLRQDHQAEDFNRVVAYLTAHRTEMRIGAIAVYAASGNVFDAFPAVEDPKQSAVTAAVIFYGSAPILQWRRDLPVLYVRAGLDRPSVNQAIASLAAAAVMANAPVTFVNYAGGHHAFEMVDDSDATRAVIENALAFVKRATSASYRAALLASIEEAGAAGDAQAGRFREASAAYRRMVTRHPDDARLRLAYGEALLGDGQASVACGEFEKVRHAGLGARDLGLPAARACLQKGDPDGAMAWLKSIPPRALPPSVENDPAFAALRDRADFRALFAGR